MKMRKCYLKADKNLQLKTKPKTLLAEGSITSLLLKC